MGGNNWASIGLLVILFVAMYFFLVRPQKKKEKQVNDMRNALSVGDEIITIGGMLGRIVRTKEDTVVVQLGADKIKVEMMRWAISEVKVKGVRERENTGVSEDETQPRPKRLRKAEPNVNENEAQENSGADKVSDEEA